MARIRFLFMCRNLITQIGDSFSKVFRCGQIMFFQIVDANGVALTGEGAGDGPANAPAGAGHKCGLHGVTSGVFLLVSSRYRVRSPTGHFWHAPKVAKKAPRGHPLASPFFYGGPNDPRTLC